MSRPRRALAMATGSIAILTFGFVVAVAAGSLPGGASDSELDVAFRGDVDLTPVLAWVLLVLALVGLVLYLLGLRQGGPREERGRRGLLVVLLSVMVFAAVLYWVRPITEAWLNEAPPPAGVTTTTADLAGDRTDSVSVGAWLFGVLLAAVVAASLTVIGLRGGRPGPVAQPAVGREVASPAPTWSTGPVTRSLGDDPRSRILSAYDEFEVALAIAGHPRADTETTRRHAGRAAAQLGLEQGLVDDLVEIHAAARYGRRDPESAEARSAEGLSESLRDRIPG